VHAMSSSPKLPREEKEEKGEKKKISLTPNHRKRKERKDVFWRTLRVREEKKKRGRLPSVAVGSGGKDASKRRPGLLRPGGKRKREKGEEKYCRPLKGGTRGALSLQGGKEEKKEGGFGPSSFDDKGGGGKQGPPLRHLAWFRLKERKGKKKGKGKSAIRPGFRKRGPRLIGRGPRMPRKEGERGKERRISSPGEKGTERKGKREPAFLALETHRHRKRGKKGKTAARDADGQPRKGRGEKKGGGRERRRSTPTQGKEEKREKRRPPTLAYPFRGGGGGKKEKRT